jgi:putative Mg2+ transporter-C (MgtC) family protein
MANDIRWQEIALRLILTVAAGALIGFDREAHKRSAGLRTTLLVALAAALSMIQANLLLDIRGKAPDSYVVLDLMRLPLGILSGVGFIGAGAILRRENMVVGVTTAATLWFATVMGLCFGGGQIYLGTASAFLGLFVLRGLKWFERRWCYHQTAILHLTTANNGLDPKELSALLKENDCLMENLSLSISKERMTSQLSCEVHWRADSMTTQMPAFLNILRQRTDVKDRVWDRMEVSKKN